MLPNGVFNRALRVGVATSASLGCAIGCGVRTGSLKTRETNRAGAMCLQDAPDVAVFCIGRLKSFQAAFCKAGRGFTISGIRNFRKQRFQAALPRRFLRIKAA